MQGGTSHEGGFQQPPVLLRERARLSASVADLVIAVHPDFAGINIRQRQLQHWHAPLQPQSQHFEHSLGAVQCLQGQIVLRPRPRKALHGNLF